MPAEIRCSSCGHGFTASEDPTRAAVACPACGAVVAVATAPAAAAKHSASQPHLEEMVGDDDAVSFGNPAERAEGDMDMTPMVDVTFLLLIFFMVTAAFSLQKSLEVPTPTESQDPSLKAEQTEVEEDPDYVIVHIDAYNTYHVITVDWEEEAPSEQELYSWLRQAREGDSSGNVPTRLLVKAHGDAMHQKVVAALDAGSELEMEEIQLQKVEDDDF